MKTINNKTKNNGAYESPVCSYLHLYAEGLLCSSVTGTITKYNEIDFDGLEDWN